MDAVEFDYRLTGVGWSRARLRMGKQSLDMSASDLGDALGDLLRAVAAAVAAGARRVLDQHGEDGYRAKWGGYPFPADELAALEALR